MKDDDFLAEQIAALLRAVAMLEALNQNVHFYTDFLSQADRNALKKMWRETLHRARVLEGRRRDGEDKTSV